MDSRGRLSHIFIILLWPTGHGPFAQNDKGAQAGSLCHQEFSLVGTPTLRGLWEAGHWPCLLEPNYPLKGLGVGV